MVRSTAAIVAGSSIPDFARGVAKASGVPLVPITINHFPDGELRVSVPDSLAGRHVFLVQSLGKQPNEYLIESMLIVDALRRGGVSRITFCCPYLAYSRQNLAEPGGASLAARLFAHFLHEAGVSELIAIDLHAEHVPSFYDFPVEHLTARTAFIERWKRLKPFPTGSLVVVGPDLGSAKLAALYAEMLQCDTALIAKRRINARKVKTLSLIGEVTGKNVLLADDMCSTAGTLVSAVTLCREKGAKRIAACVTHGLFSEDALERLRDLGLERILVSDSVEQPPSVVSDPRFCVVSLVPLVAATVKKKASS